MHRHRNRLPLRALPLAALTSLFAAPGCAPGPDTVAPARAPGASRATSATSATRGTSVASDAPTVLDEIGTNVRSASRWFGMVADLTFTTDPNGALAPRYASLRSPLVLRRDGAGQTLRPQLPPSAEGAHLIALEGSDTVWVRTREPAARAVAAQVIHGVVVYPGALAGGDLLYKLTPTHVDEYLYLRQPPPQLTRRVALERGPGVSALRETTASVEVLDAQGVARLRLTPPLARASDGTRRRGTLRLEGDEVVMELDLRGLAAPVLVDPDWSTTGTMTVGHWEDAAWRMGDGRVMVVAGCALSGCPSSFAASSCGQVLADTEIWNQPSGTWMAGPPLASPRYAFGGADLAGGDYLVAGGCTQPNCADATDTAERYTASTNRWSSAGSLSVRRGNLAMVALSGGAALAAGGCDRASCATAVDRYDPARNAWTRAASLDAPRGYATSTVLADGRVLLTGGCSDAACASVLSDAVLYDPAADRWSGAGTMGSARAGHTATLLDDGSVLVVGGCADAACVRTLPSAEIWTVSAGFRATTTLPGARHNHTATRLEGGSVLVGGGATDSTTSLPTALVFVPAGERWIAVESMQLDRAYHAAVLLNSHDVLMAGGCNPQTCMPWCEVYSPANLPVQIADGGAPQDAATDAHGEPDVVAVAASPHPAAYRNGAAHCATNTTQGLDCPLRSYPLQDPDFQPSAQNFAATAAGEVTDRTTGLIWQAGDDGTVSDQAGAERHCATFASASTPAGAWRLPNVVELMTLVNYGINNPSIDPLFQGTIPTNYWTSTRVGSGASQSWTVKFDFGEIVALSNTRPGAVRCVRGATLGVAAGSDHVRRAGPLVAEGVTVRDEAGGLEWQRTDDGVRRSWQDALAYCATLSLAGRGGWHVPNTNELSSLVEYASATGGAVIDPAFEGARPDLYWTGTTNDGVPTLSWSISFNLGVVDGVTVTGLAYTRCVRHLDRVQPGGEPFVPSLGGGGCRCRAGAVGAPANHGSGRPLAALFALVAALSCAAAGRRRSGR